MTWPQPRKSRSRLRQSVRQARRLHSRIPDSHPALADRQYEPAFQFWRSENIHAHAEIGSRYRQRQSRPDNSKDDLTRPLCARMTRHLASLQQVTLAPGQSVLPWMLATPSALRPPDSSRALYFSATSRASSNFSQELSRNVSTDESRARTDAVRRSCCSPAWEAQPGYLASRRR